MFKLKILFLFLLFTASTEKGCDDKVETSTESTSSTSTEDSNPKGGNSKEEENVHSLKPIVTGAAQLEAYLPLLKNKNVALLINQTSVIGEESIVDVLLSKNISIQKIFAPEHGFRGTADAGAHIENGKDPKTGLPIISLHGSHKKPKAEDMAGIDVLIFDIQDVGARFYTYISSMHYVMEACAENNVAFLVLDRPNPNGHYIDGPVLEKSHQSFVGMHPIPVVHGMTVGEYAQMINGEGWLENKQKAKLTVIPCQQYTHETSYSLPIKPSPNLPNNRSIYLYPSLCFFEGTVASIGRGTDRQFQVIGHPDYPDDSFSFTPVPKPGASKPKLQDQLCKGLDFSTYPLIDELRSHTQQLRIEWLISFYNKLNMGESFFNKNLFFDKLAGGERLREQIINGKTAEEIHNSWKSDLLGFQQIRKKYLLYPDFTKD
ncbi:MAG: hypothetical protein ACI8YQ_001021 [Polaribacter sp.]|jgi:uncharacterized protein YbbC (DUF1343 family)